MIFINGEKWNVPRFPDGTFNVKMPMPEKSNNEIVWLFDNMEEIVLIYYFMSHAREHHRDFFYRLIMPYIPEARMDRVKHEEEIFTLKYFCNFINEMRFDDVVVLDPHSTVSTALIDRCHIITSKPYIWEVLAGLPRNTMLFYPDSGSVKKYSKMFLRPYLFGVKQRNWENQKIEKLQIVGDEENVRDHPILMVDDICCKGTTMYYAAKRLKEMGAGPIYVYVSHCENTVLKPNCDGKSLLDYDLINTLYTTNSIWRANHYKVEVIKEIQNVKIFDWSNER